MKRSEVIEELLESYYFQHGKRVDSKVIDKTNKIIKFFEKEESILVGEKNEV
jgi:hypothetical protein